MHIRRLIYSDFGRIVISILLGLGLATIFRKVCNDRNCLIFKAPKLEKVKGQVFKFDGKCYKYREEAVKCDSTKKIIDF